MTDETQEQQITAVGNEMSASFLAAKKRSDATLAAIEQNPGKFTMLTGDRPTGRLHLGHYFGSIRERVAMQNRGVNSNIIIADYQVITDRDTTEHIEDNVLNLVLDYMTAGRRLLHRCRRPAVDGPRPGSRHLPQLEARRTPFAPLLRGGR